MMEKFDIPEPDFSDPQDDEYETPIELYYELCRKYEIDPMLDVATNSINGHFNGKCRDNFTPEFDALKHDWHPTQTVYKQYDVWCNPPHSLTEEFVLKADEQWKKLNINILMIVPANAICAHYFDPILSGSPIHASYHRIPGRPVFLRDGKPAPNSSRNSYFAVVWRKR
jgi:hypothetical protein